jgi:acyl CoA:acetate/3-ketoacid CoA transferase alpha subunit
VLLKEFNEMTLMLGSFGLCGIPEKIIKATEVTLIVPNYVKKMVFN